VERHVTFEFDALLFDLDGTLVDSIPAVDRAWGDFSARHGLDASYVMTQIHGRRSIDSIRLLLPHVDAEEEDAWLRHRESTDTEGITPIAGAIELVNSLQGPWAVVTSGNTEVGTARMLAVNLRTPKVAVFGEEVANGKPAPDPFLLGAYRLGISPEKCLVFEDTVAGIRAAHAAGMKVIALTTTAPLDKLGEADGIIDNYFDVVISEDGKSLTIG